MKFATTKVLRFYQLQTSKPSQKKLIAPFISNPGNPDQSYPDQSSQIIHPSTAQTPPNTPPKKQLLWTFSQENQSTNTSNNPKTTDQAQRSRISPGPSGCELKNSRIKPRSRLHPFHQAPNTTASKNSIKLSTPPQEPPATASDRIQHHPELQTLAQTTKIRKWD